VKRRHGPVSGWREFQAAVQSDSEGIAWLMSTRRTQTNEAARCATLLPLLARLPQPIALVEIGASAGLLLLPDYYGYDYAGQRIGPSRNSAIPPPVFTCRPDSATPIPSRNIEVVWRCGLDIEPIDLRDEEEVRWLEALVWPDEGQRLRLLREAIAVARLNPPQIRKGDAQTDVPEVVAAAPTGATLVVFHSALMPYLSPDARLTVADIVRTQHSVWIANEAPSMQPAAAERARSSPKPGAFLLSKDEIPIAWTDPHGAWIEWITDQ
jgi:hypothetical protein